MLDMMRISVHEVSHAAIAWILGYVVESVSIVGPTNNPGSIEKREPIGAEPGSPAWCRKNLAVFVAGYLGEEVIYGDYERKFVDNTDPECDFAVIDQAAIETLEIESDMKVLTANPNVANLRHKWRVLFPRFAWKQYDQLIEEVESEVTADLMKLKPGIIQLTEVLLASRVMLGPMWTAWFAQHGHAYKK